MVFVARFLIEFIKENQVDFEDNLTTISQAQKALEEAYREMGIDIKDEENDH